MKQREPDTPPVERLMRQTGYDRETCELLLEGEDEVQYVRYVVECKRLHVLAQRLVNVGMDAGEALDRLWEPYAAGGLFQLEKAFRRIEREVKSAS